MTHHQRIRRIQRWMSLSSGGIPHGLCIHYNARLSLAYHDDKRSRHHRRKTRAFNLFAVELAWLCSYALKEVS